MSDYRSALQVARDAASAAATLLLEECARPEGPRGERGHCPADVDAERAIRERLSAAFPEWGFLGEETGYQASSDPGAHLWVVDPNDGTASMQEGYRGHAVSIGLLREGTPVLGVVWAVDAPDDQGDYFAWAEGCGPLVRNGVPVPPPAWPERLGPHDIVWLSQAADQHPGGNLSCIAPARFRSIPSIAYRLALVAAGEGVAGVSLNRPGSWDYAAGHALLRGAGGRLVDEDGNEVHYLRSGRSHTRWCFGGAPEVVAALARRPWHGVAGSHFDGEVAPPPGFEPARLRPGALVHDTGRLRRAQGCLLGQLAGDALGSLVEFRAPAAIARAYPDGPRQLEDGGSWNTMAGQPTDDSELALMLARSLVLTGGFDPEMAATGYARWYHKWVHQEAPVRCDHAWCRPFDVGETIRIALASVTPGSVANGTAAADAEAGASRDSQANGALMRVSPLGIWGARRDPEEVGAAARADARLTHPHPVCQEASAAFAVALAHAIATGDNAREVYDWTLAWTGAHCQETAVRDAIARAGSEPVDDPGTHSGWVLLALQNAFFQLVHTSSPEAAIVETVRQGGDTDTNGAICGALVGAVYGRLALPARWQSLVLSCRPMPGHRGIRQPRPALYWPTDALVLAERLLQAGAEPEP